MEQTMDEVEHIYSIRKKRGVTLRTAAEYNIKSRKEIKNIDSIFSLKDQDKEKVLALLYLFASDENDDVLQIYRSATGLQDALYNSTNARITQYNILLIAALIFNPGFYAMAVNYYEAISAGFPVVPLVPVPPHDPASEPITTRWEYGFIIILLDKNSRQIIIPQMTAPLQERGVNKDDTEDFNAMISDCTKKIEANPDDKDARIMRGLAFYKTSEWYDALKDLQVVSEMDTKGMEGVYYAIANSYIQTGKRQKAIEVYEKIKAINPEFADVNELLKIYKRKEE
jgi:tetratricopeptide (TPR) repeat protein